MYRSRAKEELREALQRLIHAVYRQPNTPACFTIPVDPEQDVDSILSDGIAELEQLRNTDLSKKNAELQRLVEAFCYLVNMEDIGISDKQFPEVFRRRRDELLKQVAAFFGEEPPPQQERLFSGSTSEQAFRAYALASSLLRSDLRSGMIEEMCLENNYSPQEIKAVKTHIEGLIGELTIRMAHLSRREARQQENGAGPDAE